MAKIQLNDAEIYYELHGSGQPIVLISGYGCDHTYWTAVLASLMHKYQVLLLDNRGSGQTYDDGRELSADLMADDVISLMRALKLQRPHLVGHSMGGTIVQRIAVRYPDEINKIVIVNSVAKWRNVALKASEAILALRQHRVNPNLMLDAVLPWLVGNAFFTHPHWVKQFKNVFLHHQHPQTLTDQTRQFHALCQFDNRADLAEIKVPTLVIASEEDLMAMVSDCQQLANGIAQAEFSIIAGGHNSAIENYRELNQLITTFLG